MISRHSVGDDLNHWGLEELEAAWHLFLSLLESQSFSAASLHGFCSTILSELLDSYMEAQGSTRPRWKLQGHFCHMVKAA